MRRKFRTLLEYLLNVLSVLGLITLLVHYSGIKKRPLSLFCKLSDEAYYGVPVTSNNYSSLAWEHLVKESNEVERREFESPKELEAVLKGQVWNHICGDNMQHMFNSPLFPYYPDEELLISRTYSKLGKNNYGRRIYGFISPPITGFYKFIIYSDDNSEFWLSDNHSVDGLRCLASVSSRADIGSAPSDEIRFKSQISEDIFLTSTMKYPVEILHYQKQELDFVELHWIIPGESSFKVIEKEFLSSTREVRPLPKQILRQENPKVSSEDNFTNPKPAFFHVALITEWIRKAALPVCSYKTESYIKRHVYRYHGHKILRTSTSLYSGAWIHDGKIQPRDPVSTVVSLFMKALEKIFPM